MAIAPLDSNYYHQFNLSMISARRRLCRPSDLTAARIFGITCTKELVASLVLFSTLDAVQRRPYCQPSRKLRINYKVQDVMICIVLACVCRQDKDVYPTETPLLHSFSTIPSDMLGTDCIGSLLSSSQHAPFDSPARILGDQIICSTQVLFYSKP